MSDLCDSSLRDTVMMIDGGKSKEMKMKRSNLEEIGETSVNMVLKNLLREARYFDPPDDVDFDCFCYSCGEEGHTCFNCLEPPRKPCFICASYEHVENQCLMGRDYCDEGGSTTETDICLRCGGLGHDTALCKYEYSKDDLKDVKCYVCGSFGHLCCVESCNSPSSAWAVSCYKCGHLGHIGLACGRHYEEHPKKCYVAKAKRWKKRYSSSELAEKKKKRIEKALAISAAIRAELEKKKQRKLEEQQHSTPHESNGNTKKNDGNSEEYSTSHESIRKKNDGNTEQQHSTLHESNGKMKKNNVESEQNFTKEEE